MLIVEACLHSTDQDGGGLQRRGRGGAVRQDGAYGHRAAALPHTSFHPIPHSDPTTNLPTHPRNNRRTRPTGSARRPPPSPTWSRSGSWRRRGAPGRRRCTRGTASCRRTPSLRRCARTPGWSLLVRGCFLFFGGGGRRGVVEWLFCGWFTIDIIAPLLNRDRPARFGAAVHGL